LLSPAALSPCSSNSSFSFCCRAYSVINEGDQNAATAAPTKRLDGRITFVGLKDFFTKSILVDDTAECRTFFDIANIDDRGSSLRLKGLRISAEFCGNLFETRVFPNASARETSNPPSAIALGTFGPYWDLCEHLFSSFPNSDEFVSEAFHNGPLSIASTTPELLLTVTS
jgi:uncharacterized protein YchJ